jgi:hypothetical protein
MRACCLVLVVLVVLLLVGCASVTSRSRLKPNDVVVQLIQFHGAVAEQYDLGGMELEHYNVVNQWIASELRILTTNAKQWEGQARLDWPKVRSICAPFELLAPWTRKINELLQ